MARSPPRRDRPRRAASAALALLLLAPSASLPRAASAAPDGGRGPDDGGTVPDDDDDGAVVGYGVDVSYPMHRPHVSINYPWLPHNSDPENYMVPTRYDGMPVQPLGDRQTFYEELMRGCRDYYRGDGEEGDGGSKCDLTERGRIEQIVRQAQSLKNYTDTGVKKIRAPARVMNALTEFWERNVHRQFREPLSDGYSFINSWESPTYLLDVSDRSLDGGGSELRRSIADAAVETVREWTGGRRLVTSSVYGIRVYGDGAVLAPHVDRLPLISSAIVNVAQDVDEDWPVEVITHDGRARNITMKPGDMVLYESHTVIHGRPFPLRGRYYANIFIHFQPEVTDGGRMPSYIIPGSPQAEYWERENGGGRGEEVKDAVDDGTTAAHIAADRGDVHELERIASTNVADLESKDKNGWRPLHVAARAGRTDAVGFLLDNGVDVNARTWGGRGSTPLHWARHVHGEDHPTVGLLKERGGIDLSPDG